VVCSRVTLHGNCTTALIASSSAEETETFGGKLASVRPPGNAFATVFLTGDLGAGKTTLARGFLRAAGVTGRVRSPTYTLLEIYTLPEVSILHLDLYRLLDPSELEPLGLREWARPGHIWLVEWPDRGAGRLPDPDITITLTAASAGHQINVKGVSALGDTWVSALELRQDGP
jgi:tRNA threonylcarbamoyladenosine biosynthesis protein TsaE